jgi:hypothetical protein
VGGGQQVRERRANVIEIYYTHYENAAMKLLFCTRHADKINKRPINTYEA